MVSMRYEEGKISEFSYTLNQLGVHFLPTAKAFTK